MLDALPGAEDGQSPPEGLLETLKALDHVHSRRIRNWLIKSATRASQF